jgi:4-alpha-glucanotransferase
VSYLDPVTAPRRSGVLLHPTSLPGPYGIGDLGPEARRFVAWLRDAGQAYWQVLPITPVGPAGSPYSSPSAFAGEPLLLSPEDLVADGLLQPADAEQLAAAWAAHDGDELDYGWQIRHKLPVLRRAARAFLARQHDPAFAADYNAFLDRSAGWLPDWARFAASKDETNGKPWWEWDGRDPDPQLVREHTALQFLFDRQMRRLHAAAQAAELLLVGDIPIFVAGDSADVWAHRDLFDLDPDGQPRVAAGCPPDAFSELGQLWGNPHYDWAANAADDYAWWKARMRTLLERVDVVRIDHFRGFEAAWAIPRGAPDARGGEWVPGPGAALFEAIAADLRVWDPVRFGDDLPLIAEDLGVITPEVEELRDGLDLPGMKILQFAFDGDPDNDYLPANQPPNSVVYTGTHDNDTARGWWDGVGPEFRDRLAAALGREVCDDGAAWALVELAETAPASTCIVPVQDLLALGNEARMNLPGTVDGNWMWRLAEPLSPELATSFRGLCADAGRVAT